MDRCEDLECGRTRLKEAPSVGIHGHDMDILSLCAARAARGVKISHFTEKNHCRCDGGTVWHDNWRTNAKEQTAWRGYTFLRSGTGWCSREGEDAARIMGAKMEDDGTK